jgi:putative transposase
MKHDPDIHRRRSIRLTGYDYSQTGAYFVTICTQNRECLFGDIVDGEMGLNDAGCIVKQCWDNIPAHFSHVELDEFIVMPNHVHGIIVIVGAQFIAPCGTITPSNHNATNNDKNHGAMKQGAINRAPTIGEIVRVFKARCTHAINQTHNTPGHPVWQRNYYEHIIRDDEEINRIREYIIENPAKWTKDNDNPGNIIRRGLINQTPTNTPSANIP